MSQLFDFSLPLLIGLAGILLFCIYAFASGVRDQMKTEAPQAVSRLPLYNRAMIQLWSVCGLCLACWYFAGEEFSALGLQHGEDWRYLLAWALSGAGCVYLVYSVVQAALSSETRKSIRKALLQEKSYDQIRPRNEAEYQRFNGLSVTAGITEEIIFRGFLLATLAMLMPIWLAALLTIGLFIVMHAYQGLSGMVRILPITIVLTTIVLIGGSLWPAIVLHIVADLVGAALFKITTFGISDDGDSNGSKLQAA